MIQNLDLKIKQLRRYQEARESRTCPRCGMRGLDSGLRYSPLSRYAAVYICENCGQDEAMRDHESGMGSGTNGRLKIEEWDYFRDEKGAEA